MQKLSNDRHIDARGGGDGEKLAFLLDTHGNLWGQFNSDSYDNYRHTPREMIRRTILARALLYFQKLSK